MKAGIILDGFVPPPLPGNIKMDGTFVRLVPVSVAAHADQLFKSFQTDIGGKNWTYLPYGPFEDVQAFTAWLETVEGCEDPVFFTIIRQADNIAVGVASYLRIAPEHGSIEVGHIHFSPLMQNTILGTEAMYLMMRWAFEAGYRRYEWKCNALNRKSRQAAQRLGLSYEGVFRQSNIYKGCNRDTAWFAAIDSEWPQLKRCFERYLDTGNLDAENRPKTSLTSLTKPLLYKHDTFEFCE